VSVYWTAFASLLPGRGTGTQAAQLVLNTFSCDYNMALMCENKNPNYSLPYAFVVMSAHGRCARGWACCEACCCDCCPRCSAARRL